MKALPVAVLILCVLAVEAIAVWDQPGHLLRPDLLLLVAVYFALWFPIRQAIYAAIAAGLLRDLYSLDPFGLSALSFAVSAVIVATLREEIYREHPITQIMLGGLIALIPAGFGVAHLALGGAATSSLLRPCAVGALHTAFFAPLIIVPLQSLGGLWGQPAPYRAFPSRI